MARNILCVLIGKRKETAVKVQQIFTAWGCLIKTRLGLHDGVLENCSEQGLVILELVGDKSQIDEMARKLEILPDVSVKLIELEIK